MVAVSVFLLSLVASSASSAFLSPLQFYSKEARSSNVSQMAFLWFGGGKEDSIDESSSKAASAYLGNVASVMDTMASFKKSQRIEKRTTGVLQDLSNQFVEGSSADGKIKFTYDGKQKPIGVQIDPNYFQSLKNGKAGSEELSKAVLEGIREAHEKSTAKMEEKMKSVYEEIGFETS